MNTSLFPSMLVTLFIFSPCPFPLIVSFLICFPLFHPFIFSFMFMLSAHNRDKRKVKVNLITLGLSENYDVKGFLPAGTVGEVFRTFT